MEVAIAIFDIARAGGIERDANRVARELIGRGHRVRLYSTSAGPLVDNIPITKLPRRGLTNHGRMAAFADDLGRVVDRRRQLVVGFQKLTGLDVLYCGDWCFAEQRRLPVLPRNRVLRQLEEACCGPLSGTALLMLSQPQADTYRRVWSIAPERITVLPATLDRRRVVGRPGDAERLNLRRAFNIKEDWSAWLWIGLHSRIKGLDRAIAALSQVRKAVLIVVGIEPTRTDASRMLEEAGRRGCRDRILSIGRADHGMLDRLFGACDLLVHPARLDVTGNVILEALGAGLPVVATANCGYAAHVSAARAGVVLPEDASPSMIARAAIAVKDKGASLSNWAQEYVSATNLTLGIQVAASRIEDIANQGCTSPLALPSAERGSPEFVT